MALLPSLPKTQNSNTLQILQERENSLQLILGDEKNLNNKLDDEL